MERRHVLFLCAGNPCRSQMAEGLVNHALGLNWHASSAGTAPSGQVHPHAAENCPLWLREGKVVHIGFDDPDTATASQEDRLVVFRRVRDEMREHVLAHLISPHNLAASS